MFKACAKVVHNVWETAVLCAMSLIYKHVFFAIGFLYAVFASLLQGLVNSLRGFVASLFSGLSTLSTGITIKTYLYKTERSNL
jgi:hypothetical protein